jgi:hypothetical protein
VEENIEGHFDLSLRFPDKVLSGLYISVQAPDL